MQTPSRNSAQALERAEIGAVLDNVPLLGKHLQPVIEESLRECGKAAYRKGTILTPLFTVFVVLGLALRRDLSYPRVIDWLVSGWRWLNCEWPAKVVQEGALSHARKRLGIEVFRRIFEKQTAPGEVRERDFHGLTSVAFDGTVMSLADTASNRERFGRPESGRGTGGYPQLRAMALLELARGQVTDIAYGPYQGKGHGERSLMKTMLERLTEPSLLLLLDAGLYSFETLYASRQRDQHLLAKLSSGAKPKRLPGKGLADGSYLAVMRNKIELPGATGQGPRKRYQKMEITVRIVAYQIPGFRPARLITTLLDPQISAKELVFHYHQRWDIEIAFDEIKTHQCATLRGQAPTVLRSKTAELVEQELYAVLIAYNLVRELIHQAAVLHHKRPRQLSFLDALQELIDALPHMSIARPAQAQRQYHYLISLIAECEIDRPQRPRINPRVVKVKMSKFKRKRPIHKSSYRDIENELQILIPTAA